MVERLALKSTPALVEGELLETTFIHRHDFAPSSADVRTVC